MIRLFNIGWHTKEDGPGNRVVLYLQGCHLRCPWCHSPHSWDMKSAPLLFQAKKCTLCGQCVKACPQGVHHIAHGQHLIDRSKCTKCGKCITVCPNSIENSMDGALSLPTTEISVKELYTKIKPQLDMFKRNGGITLSGGEALLQKEEVRELLLLCKRDGISTCVGLRGFLACGPSRHELRAGEFQERRHHNTEHQGCSGPLPEDFRALPAYRLQDNRGHPPGTIRLHNGSDRHNGCRNFAMQPEHGAILHALGHSLQTGTGFQYPIRQAISKSLRIFQITQSHSQK